MCCHFVKLMCNSTDNTQFIYVVTFLRKSFLIYLANLFTTYKMLSNEQLQKESIYIYYRHHNKHNRMHIFYIHIVLCNKTCYIDSVLSDFYFICFSFSYTQESKSLCLYTDNATHFITTVV